MSLPIRWGILSTAQIGRSFIRGVGKSSSGCVQAVASREYTRAFEFAKENGIPRAFGSYDEMLGAGEVDLIYNALPNNLHAEWTIRALEAGIPVLCEKPCAANADETRQIASVAARTGKLVAEAFMYRHHPLYAQVLDLIVSGAIGDVISLRAVFSFHLEEEKTEAHEWVARAGGGLMDVGCYCVSFCRLITGKEPVKVSAIQRAHDIDYSLMGLLEFPNGVLAHVECSLETEEERTAEIIGTKGVIAIENPWYPGEDRGRFTVRSEQGEKIYTTPGADPYQLEADEFINAYKTHQPLRWPINDAVANMTVIDALRASAREGRVIALS